jgi:hypothetical protein
MEAYCFLMMMISKTKKPGRATRNKKQKMQRSSKFLNDGHLKKKHIMS